VPPAMLRVPERSLKTSGSLACTDGRDKQKKMATKAMQFNGFPIANLLGRNFGCG